MGQWYFPSDADVVNWNNVIDYGGFKWLLTEDEKLIHLFHTQASSSGTWSLEDQNTNIDYQVPTGKKLKIIFIDDFTDAASLVRLISATAADSNNGEQLLIQRGTNAGKLTGLMWIKDVPADLYISGKPSSAAAWTIQMTGIEMTA